MKKGILSGLLLAFMVLVSAQVSAREVGNGNVITKTIAVNEYTEVLLGGSINFSSEGWKSLFASGKKKGDAVCRFDYNQTSGKASLSVTMDENLFEFLTIESTGGKLKVSVKKGSQIAPSKIHLKGTSKDLNRVAISNCMDFYLLGDFSTQKLSVGLSGSGDVKMKNRANVTACEFKISGAGDIDAKNLVCDTFEASISGAGDIDLKGKANTAKYYVSGAGDISAYGFEAKDVTCRVSGCGDLEVYASEHLDASASGAGDISYKGDAVAKTKVIGSADINKVR